MADNAFAHIAALSREALQARWEAIYKAPPPQGLHRGLLERAIAWHEQAARDGGLPLWVQRQLAATGATGGLARRKGGAARACSRPTAGTRLVREWGGRTHFVEVTSDAFVWKGKRYGSLSAVAKAITGARWSGPRFFGLDRAGGDRR